MLRWPEELYGYIRDHSRLNDPLLTEMEEHAAAGDFPIIGPLVGPWLHFFTRLTAAKRVFELGSGFGYSTWYFATALKENGGGVVTHTVWDGGLSRQARELLARAGLIEHCEFIVSEAVAALKQAPGGLDIIFMDIDKEGYPAALPVIEQKLRPGGLLLIDNVLWKGMVVDENDTSQANRAVREMNSYLRDSPRWRYLINPLRDGLGVALLLS